MNPRDVLERLGDSDMVIFWCVGCDEFHQISTTKWEFNGDFVKPTFSPSYLTWVDPNPKADPIKFPKFYSGFRCHSFIRDGRIQYLDDCTHELAGKTIDIPIFPVDK